jgi:hypothetical protein
MWKLGSPRWSLDLVEDSRILLHCSLAFEWFVRHFQGRVILTGNSLLLFHSHHIRVHISENIIGILAHMIQQ